MLDIDSLENLLPEETGSLLDASDFARLRMLDLPTLNKLILEVSHELYQPEATDFEARASVVSLINLGLLSIRQIYQAPLYA